ncbi:MAG: ribosome hibernation-promoting factor, HPF/YfiA family [Planctomycetota bacterium]
MDVEIAGRHMDVTEPMERHIRQQIDKLPRFASMVRYLTVTLDTDSGGQHVEIIANCPRSDLVAEARSHDIYQCIDGAFAKIERRLARYHDKLVKSRSREAQQASETDKRVG